MRRPALFAAVTPLVIDGVIILISLGLDDKERSSGHAPSRPRAETTQLRNR